MCGLDLKSFVNSKNVFSIEEIEIETRETQERVMWCDEFDFLCFFTRLLEALFFFFESVSDNRGELLNLHFEKEMKTNDG